jgi:hypothetical protein
MACTLLSSRAIRISPCDPDKSVATTIFLQPENHTFLDTFVECFECGQEAVSMTNHRSTARNAERMYRHDRPSMVSWTCGNEFCEHFCCRLSACTRCL